MMARWSLRGFMQRKLRVAADRHRDRARRRADGRHLHPHRHDQPARSRGSSRPASKGHDVGRHRPTKRSAANADVADLADHRQRCSRRCARCPGVAEAAGAIFTPGDVPRRARQAADQRRRAGVRRLDRCRRASSHFTPVQGRFPTQRRRGRDRPGDGRALRALKRRPADASSPARAPPTRYTIVGHRQVRRRRIVRRRRRRRC